MWTWQKKKGRRSQRQSKKTNIFCFSLVATTGKKAQLLCLPMHLVARFLEAARSTPKCCKKETAKGLIPSVSLPEMNVEICDSRENRKKKKVKYNSALKSDCKCGTLGVSIMLKTIPICHSLPCQKCWFLEHYFLWGLRYNQKFQSKAESLLWWVH